MVLENNNVRSDQQTIKWHGCSVRCVKDDNSGTIKKIKNNPNNGINTVGNLVQGTVLFNMYSGKNSRVILSLYTVAGEKVAQLTSGEYDKGTVSIMWDGMGLDGHMVSNGTYVYQFMSSSSITTGQFIYIRK